MLHNRSREHRLVLNRQELILGQRLAGSSQIRKQPEVSVMYYKDFNLNNVEKASPNLFDVEQQYMSPGLQEVAQLSQLVVKNGRGCYLEDTEGRRYLDFMAGVAVCSLGHCHPDYVAALKRQLDKVSVGSFTTENRVKLLQLIASLTPEGLTKTQLYSGGAEAVEAALRLANSYTKKFEVLSF